MSPAFRDPARPGLLAAIFLAVALVTACAPTRAPLDDAGSELFPEATTPRSSLEASAPVDLRVVYVIHGDADYSFHDSIGNRRYADREAVLQARDVGRRAKRAEVFIFHQTPSKPRLFETSQKAGNYYHYRAGVLLARTSYYRVEDANPLQAEAALLRRDADSASPRSVFAYFGHEIPVTRQKGYFASDPEREFSTEHFAQGIANLGNALNREGMPAPKPFDLTIVSACYGGTPALLRALAPLTRRVVASPAYLHLSYLDTRALGDFAALSGRDAERHPQPPYGERDMGALADDIAAQSFVRLETLTQTEITVGVYQVDSAAAFLASPVGLLKPVGKGGQWKDCEGDPAFNAREAMRGVRLYYKPPRFGALKNKATRSAWQCLL